MSRRHHHKKPASGIRSSRILTLAAGLAFGLALLNVVLHLGNRQRAAEVSSRAAFIQQSLKLSRLNDEIIKSLAVLAARSGDDQIKDLLARQGISYRLNGRADPGSGPQEDP